MKARPRGGGGEGGHLLCPRSVEEIAEDKSDTSASDLYLLLGIIEKMRVLHWLYTTYWRHYPTGHLVSSGYSQDAIAHVSYACSIWCVGGEASSFCGRGMGGGQDGNRPT